MIVGVTISGDHMADIIDRIDARIKERSILKHPFYQAWQMGKLTKEMLREYAKQYYQHVSAFPQYLSAVHSKLDDFEDRKLILQNLMDEENGEKNHLELWLRFGDAVGAKRDEVRTTVQSGETRAFINNFKQLASQSPVEGIAALYAYESQIPKVSEEKISGLKQFYGVQDEHGLEYFTVHQTADVEHSEAEMGLIRKYAKDEATQEKVLEAVDRTLDAYWLMLTGIQRWCEKHSG